MVRKNNLHYNDYRREEGMDDTYSTEPDNDGNATRVGLKSTDTSCPSEVHFELVYFFSSLIWKFSKQSKVEGILQATPIYPTLTFYN